jgi:CDP-glucose 4,6-dehydratase
MEELEMNNFYNGKKVFITGHTGFKGAWMCQVLLQLGANLTGYALSPIKPSLFDALDLNNRMQSIIGDIRDFSRLKQSVASFQPEIVIHMAAQPLVIDSYDNPTYTYETNVMGTAYILEAVRNTDSIKSFINITTDKVYNNKEWDWGYREIDELNGYDPYSNSKSCSELVTDSFRKSFFQSRDIAISTVRAGNVIGGGDFSANRIIPDCVRAALLKSNIEVRNAASIRPYQHVLDPIFAYLMIAEKQFYNKTVSGAYNIGPDEKDCVTTKCLVDLFCRIWGEGQRWESKSMKGPHEAGFLKLDCSKMKNTFQWHPVWNIEEAMKKTIELYKVHSNGENILPCISEQIKLFLDAKNLTRS